MRKLGLPFLNHEGGEVSSIKWRIANFVHDVGNAADMIEVTVSNDDGPNFFLSLLQIFGVGQNVINARSIFLLEFKADINDDNVAINFNNRHVLADFFYSAKRNNPDIFADRRNFTGFFSAFPFKGGARRREE